jgi:hypothetical protein
MGPGFSRERDVFGSTRDSHWVHCRPGLYRIQQAPLSPQLVGRLLQPQIDDVQYTPSLEALSQVFSVYGTLAKMLLLCRAGAWQALVQYTDAAAAAVAREYLNGHSMYPGANTVRRGGA